MNTIVIRYILLFFFCGTFLSVFSQTFPYYHYTTKDGLVNSNVYYSHQDKLGYIWFATNNGISRFDGNTFQNYFIQDGLNSNSFTSIAVGEDSTIYFANFDKGINTYKNGTFSNYQINTTSSFTVSTMALRNDTLYIKQNNKIFSVIYNHIIHQRLGDPLNFINILSLYPYKSINSSSYKLLISNETGLFEISDEYSSKTLKSETDKIPVYGITEDKYNNLWLGCNGKILKYSGNKVEQIINLNSDIAGKVNKLLVDNRGIVWFHTMNKGLHIFKNNEIIDIGSKISIGKTPINHIYEDKEGNVWVSTSGKGVFCFNNTSVSIYTEKDGLSNNSINSILVNYKGSKLIGTFDGLNILEMNRFVKIVSGKELDITNYIYKIKAGLNNNYLICGAYSLLSFERIYNSNRIYFVTSSAACQIDTSTFVFNCNAKELTLINYKGDKTLKIGEHDSSKRSWNTIKRNKINAIQIKSIFGDSAANLRINEIEKTSDGNLWVGTSMGLCKINGDIKTYFKDDTVLNAKINCIKVNQPGYILIAGDKGISIIDRNTEKIVSLEKTEHFDFNSSTSIDVDNDKNIWIGNLKGLYRIPLDSFLNGKHSGINFFNEKTSLPSSEIRTISYDKLSNELWVGTPDGLVKMELNDLNNHLQHPPKVLIENLILSDTILSNFKNIVFKPSQNNIRIHYTSLNFNAPKSIKYEYKFENDNEWTETEYSDIELFSQPPGEYNLLLRTVNINNEKGETASLKFEILAPYWKTPYFYTLVAIIVVVIIFYAAQKRVIYIKNKSAEEIRIQNSISELRHQALSASMNPHFIFNTLNSIQAYMNTHNKEEANEYLVNFSSLIRLNLDLAGKTFIPLETELYRLELYLKYEKIRFEDMLNFKIIVDENINIKSLLIPNMILQPFVENSIWHGILHNEESGTISINISKDNELVFEKRLDVIKIRILDDGVGLEASKTKKSNHTSKGMSIIKERLKLLAGDNPDYEYLKIENRSDNITGTLVTITLIPEQYKENHSEESSNSIPV